jgi:hypothetical protein
MIRPELVIVDGQSAELGSNGLESVFFAGIS